MCIYLIRFYHNIYTDTNKWIFLLFYKNEVCMGARTILDDLRVKKSNNSVHGYSCTTDLLATSRSITITQDNPGTVPGYGAVLLFWCTTVVPVQIFDICTISRLGTIFQYLWLTRSSTEICQVSRDQATHIPKFFGIIPYSSRVTSCFVVKLVYRYSARVRIIPNIFGIFLPAQNRYQILEFAGMDPKFTIFFGIQWTLVPG